MIRNIQMTIDELTKIESTTSNIKVKTMAQAIIWGLSSGRTGYSLEYKLYNESDLHCVLDECIIAWNGNDWLSGAFYAANHLYNVSKA